MPKTTSERRRQIAKRYRRCPIDCPPYLDHEIVTLSDFFGVFHALLDPGKVFGFAATRGWTTPSPLQRSGARTLTAGSVLSR